MPRFLPLRASVEWLRRAAKDRHAALCAADPDAPLHQAQLDIAREYGFPSWRAMIAHVEEVREKLRAAFPAAYQDRPPQPLPIPPDDADLAALLAAVRAGDVTVTTELLNRRPALAMSRGPEGQTPLHVAAECNDARLAIVLLAYEADPEATYGESGHTALSWAAVCHAMDFARALIRLAVQPDLYAAAGVCDVEAVRGFFDDAGRLIPGSARTGSSRFSADGKRLPCPPESEEEQLLDALCMACRNGRVEAAEFLLSKLPKTEFRGFMGATPLHWACFGGSTTIVERLLAAGADPTIRDHDLKCTPRNFGICAPANWGLHFLVRARLDADPTLLNLMDGQTSALHEAAAGGSLETVRLLLERGANPMLRDGKGRIASDRAAEKAHPEIVALLKAAEAG